MHVAFTTDDEGARPVFAWVLRHLLTCRGWFPETSKAVSERTVTIHYGDAQSPPEAGEAPGPLLLIDRGSAPFSAPPPPPGKARAPEGRELLVSYPDAGAGRPAGGRTIWTREDGSGLATLESASDSTGRSIVTLSADVVHPAAFLVTRNEERNGPRDSLDRFDPAGSWLAKHGLLETPVVDEIGWLFHDLLRRLLESSGSWSACRSPWPAGRSHAIAITHDQDQSIRWERRLARHTLGALRGPDRRRQVALLLRDLREGAVSPVLMTDRLLRWERERNVEATYFFLTVPRDRFGRRYDVSSAPFRRLLGAMRSEGHSVGLHGSLRTCGDGDLFERERARIGDVLGSPPAGVRQHYLRIQLPETWALQQKAGFRYDASLGFPDQPGFRAGTSYPFPPENMPSFLAIPLTGMDRALLARGLTTPEAWHEWAAPARRAEGLVDVLWHPYFVDSDLGPDRERATIAMLDWASSSGAWVAGLDRIDEWWRARNAFRMIETGVAAGEERIVFRADAPIRELALTLEGADSDIRIAGTDGIEARWSGARITVDAEAGGTMTLSRKKR
ncbi:MAG: hypothetical protein HKN20_10570 [Gemmatimonadetes bacterium]|nr:hypothetical protein [Gemmatimonadota bacterium]